MKGYNWIDLRLVFSIVIASRSHTHTFISYLFHTHMSHLFVKNLCASFWVIYTIILIHDTVSEFPTFFFSISLFYFHFISFRFSFSGLVWDYTPHMSLTFTSHLHNNVGFISMQKVYFSSYTSKKKGKKVNMIRIAIDGILIRYKKEL